MVVTFSSSFSNAVTDEAVGMFVKMVFHYCSGEMFMVIVLLLE